MNIYSKALYSLIAPLKYFKNPRIKFVINYEQHYMYYQNLRNCRHNEF
jgi:hypothetical protein